MDPVTAARLALSGATTLYNNRADNYRRNRESTAAQRRGAIRLGSNQRTIGSAPNWQRPSHTPPTPPRSQPKRVKVEAGSLPQNMKGSKGMFKAGTTRNPDAVAFVSRKKKKNISKPKSKTVKVSKAFKRKVGAALEKSEYTPKGTVIYNMIGHGVVTGPTNGQRVGPLCTKPNVTTSPANVSATNWSFSVEEQIHWLSVLWNRKDQAIDKNDVTRAAMQLNSTNSLAFRLPKLKYTLISSREDYVLKNVSDRVVNGIIYLCAPKKVGQMNFNYTYSNASNASPRSADFMLNLPYMTHVLDATGSTTEKWTFADQSDAAAEGLGAAIPPPDVAWWASIDSMLEGGYTTSGHAGYPVQWGMVPEGTYFSKFYTFEKTQFVLNPGQSFTYSYAGPKGQKMDCSKWLSRDTTTGVAQSGKLLVNNVQKFVRIPMLVTWNDTAVGVATGPTAYTFGHFSDSNVDVVIDRTTHYTFGCPNLIDSLVPETVTGSAVPNAGVATPLMSIRVPKYHVGITPSIASATHTSIHDVVPVAYGTGNDTVP